MTTTKHFSLQNYICQFITNNFKLLMARELACKWTSLDKQIFIYVIQQDTQYLMINFIHNIQ